jgi:hypothetical protein
MVPLLIAMELNPYPLLLPLPQPHPQALAPKGGSG